MLARTALLTLLLASPPVAAQAPAEPRSAASFWDSIGIVTHMGAPSTGPSGTSYGNVEAIVRELAMVRIRHVREALLIGPDVGRLETLHQRLGVMFLLAYDNYAPDGGTATLAGGLATVRQHRGMVEAVEGPNEPDQFGLHYNGLSGAPAVVALQQALYRGVKTDPALASLPVYCPALSFPAQGGMADKLPDLSPFCDVATAHVYVENRSIGPFLPGDFVAHWAHFPASFVPGRPTVITEGGWLTSTNDEQGVDEATQAKYIMTFLLDTFSQGIVRTYLYDLSDDGADPKFTTPDNHYGLFRYDGTPKPAAHMMATLAATLGEEGTPPAGPLDYRVIGLPSEGRQLLLRRSDGAFLLALWREAYLWDRFRHRPVDIAPITVAVELGGGAHSVQRIDVMPGGPAPETLPLRNGRVSADIPDHPVFLLIR